MSGCRFHFAMLRICCTNAVLILATKRSVSGGTELARYQALRPQSSIEIPQENDETARRTGYHCDRQIALLLRCNEGHLQCVETGNGTAGLTTGPTTLICRFDVKNGRCSDFGKCEVCKNSLPFTPQSTTTSTRSATFTHGPISNSTKPTLLLSAAVSVRYLVETSSNSSDSTRQ